jgi:hypothetical protein
MKIKLIEEPLLCPVCHNRMTGLGLHDRQCATCGMRRRLESDETHRTDERLLLSWEAVPREIGPRASRRQLMVRPPKDNMMDGTFPSLSAKRSPFSQPQQVTGRSSDSPCPICGSITVRSRGGRDMCLICGYLQSHA